MSAARAWDRGAGLVVVAVVAAHLRFVWMDGRVPRDPGLYYQGLPRVHAALTEGSIGQVFAELVEPAGWYNALLGILTYVFGRQPELMHVVMVGWIVLTLVAAWQVGRRLGGPATGFATTALLASSPMVVNLGRTPWIHAPELALVLVSLAAWLSDRELEHRRTVAVLLLSGVLTVTLRHSGLVWIGPLGLAMLWPTGQPRRWWRLLLVLGSWTVSLIVPSMQLQAYMGAKLLARDRYAADLPPLGEQLSVNVGLPLLLIGFAGIALALWRRPERRDPAEAMLGTWAVLVLVLWAGFRAGIDNFPPLSAAIAALAAVGLTRLHAKAPALALLAFLPAFLPQWVAPERLVWLTRFPGGPNLVMQAHPRNWYRPWRGFGWEQVEDLVDATCGAVEPGMCAVVVDQGLFEPYVEDPGHLELFLVGEDRVRLLPLREHLDLDLDTRYAALIVYTCPGQQPAWESRFPKESERRRGLEQGGVLQPAWARPTMTGCTIVWWTPGGELRHPDRAPSDGRLVVDGDLGWLEAVTPEGQPDGMLGPGPGHYQGLPPRDGDPPPPPEGKAPAPHGEPGGWKGLVPLDGEPKPPPPPDQR